MGKYMVIFHFPYYKGSISEYMKQRFYGKSLEDIKLQAQEVISENAPDKQIISKGVPIWENVTVVNIIQGELAEQLDEKHVHGCIDCTEDGVTLHMLD